MEIYASREAFGFARDIVGSTKRFTIFNKFVVMFLEHILTPSFVSLEMFDVCLVLNNDDCLG